MTEEEIRKYCIEAAMALNNFGDAKVLIKNAKAIEEFITGAKAKE
jgi:hypothetical protein